MCNSLCLWEVKITTNAIQEKARLWLGQTVLFSVGTVKNEDLQNFDGPRGPSKMTVPIFLTVPKILTVPGDRQGDRQKKNHGLFWIFGDMVCLWNSGYVNISRMVLILEWLARRLASLYSITCLNIYWQRIWMKIETFFYSYKTSRLPTRR